MSRGAFDPLLGLATLLRHRVRFVVIGGFAGRLWGSPTLTNDLDVCYAREDANLEALATALRELGARLRGAPGDLRFPLSAASLRAGDHFTFVTRAGNLDCLGLPAGAEDFDALERAATVMDLDGLHVRVAALEDLIRMKRAAGRPKDRIEVEVLGALREEIERDNEIRPRVSPRRPRLR
ncbi:MAG TPA: hypothetical protein VIC59_11540 [Gemmatimonadota bacterium]|jgi:hypothetical protein